MYEIDKERFGAFIAELRKDCGMTQKELAGRLYISDKAVSKWETGHSVPDITLLVPLAEILGVTVTELLECHRMEHAGTLDVVQTDNLVKKVIGLSEEESVARPQWKKEHFRIYFGSVAVVLFEVFLMVRFREVLHMFVFPDLYTLFMMLGMGLLFGIYFWFFMKERLPSYYDENKINVYVDGIMHMNIPGVYFNNSNWNYIVKAFRLWSTVGMVALPVCYLPVSILFAGFRPLSDIYILLVLYLGGLFLPPYLLAKKYQKE